jgi:hypothetical protein
MHSTRFKRSAPAALVMNHRRAWKRGDNRFEVVSRDATKRYKVVVEGGMPLCDCTAAQFGRPCLHAATVLRRLMREGQVAA